MRGLRAVVSLAIPLLLVPAGAGAYSFLPAGFAAGEKIIEIQLSGEASPAVQVNTGANPNDPADDTLAFSASVSRITTTHDIYNITPGTVLVSGNLDFAYFPVAPGFGGWVMAEFSSSMVDLTILDTGFGILLEADYATTFGFAANEPVAGLIQGSIGGDFDVVGGDADFVAAFGAGGDISGVLASFLPGGDICDLTNAPGLCEIPGMEGTDLASFTATTTATIQPIPEPGTLLLLGLGMAGLAALRRQH